MDGDRMLNLAGAGLALFVLGTVVLVGALVVTSEPPAEAPDVEWSVERVNETHVRVEHAGGSPVTAANLTVTVDGSERRTGWSGPVVQGQSTVLSAETGAVVRVFYGVGDDRDLMLRREV